MELNNIFGFIASKIDGSEKIFDFSEKISIPEAYSYEKFLPGVIDQGKQQICVPCSISAYLNWSINSEDGKVKNNGISLMEIYESRTNNGEGMSYKDALRFCKHNGVHTDSSLVRINSYSLIEDAKALKYALVMNGPCLSALPVYSTRKDFWNRRGNERLQGYHAISIVGYDEEGFIIRNSWGKVFGDNGYTKIKYSEFDKLIETWTIIQ